MEKEEFDAFLKKFVAIPEACFLDQVRSVFHEFDVAQTKKLKLVTNYMTSGEIPANKARLKNEIYRLLLYPSIAKALETYSNSKRGGTAKWTYIQTLCGKIEEDYSVTRAASETDTSELGNEDLARYFNRLKKIEAGNDEFCIAVYFFLKENSPDAKSHIEEQLFGAGKSLEGVLAEFQEDETKSKTQQKPPVQEPASKTPLFYEHKSVKDAVSNRINELKKNFSGRVANLKKIDAFISQTDGGLMVVSAPAGTGKSALLANWFEARRWTNDNEQVVGHFFSNGDDRLSNVEKAIGNLVWEINDNQHWQALDLLSENSDPWESLYQAVQHPAPENEKLIIVLDGLDEAAQIIKPLIDQAGIGANVYIIISGRKETDYEPEYLRDWAVFENSDFRIKLKNLKNKGIKEWLEKVFPKWEKSRIDQLGESLKKTTEGLPLFLSFVIDDLDKKRDELNDPELLAQFIKDLPRLFHKYLWQQLDKLAGNPSIDWDETVKPLFALLSIIKGPISNAELDIYLEGGCPSFAALKYPVTRWLSNSAGNWSFSHPRLARTFAQVIGLEEDQVKDGKERKSWFAKKTERGFIKKMEEVWNPEKTPHLERFERKYALDWLTGHLLEDGKGNYTALGVKYLSNPAFLVEQMKDEARAYNRFRRAMNLWASLPNETKLTDAGKKWTAFVSENESALKQALLECERTDIRFVDILRQCLGDAGLFEKPITYKASPRHYTGLIRSIQSNNIKGIVYASPHIVGRDKDGKVHFWDEDGNRDKDYGIQVNGYKIEKVLVDSEQIILRVMNEYEGQPTRSFHCYDKTGQKIDWETISTPNQSANLQSLVFGRYLVSWTGQDLYIQRPDISSNIWQSDNSLGAKNIDKIIVHDGVLIGFGRSSSLYCWVIKDEQRLLCTELKVGDTDHIHNVFSNGGTLFIVNNNKILKSAEISDQKLIFQDVSIDIRLEHEEDILGLYQHNDFIITWDRDGKICLWTRNGGYIESHIEDNLSDILFLPSRKHLLCLCEGHLRFWHHEVLHSTLGDNRNRKPTAITGGHGTVIVGYANGLIQFHDEADGPEETYQIKPSDGYSGLAYQRNQLISWRQNGNIIAWPLKHEEGFIANLKRLVFSNTPKEFNDPLSDYLRGVGVFENQLISWYDNNKVQYWNSDAGVISKGADFEGPYEDGIAGAVIIDGDLFVWGWYGSFSQKQFFEGEAPGGHKFDHKHEAPIIHIWKDENYLFTCSEDGIIQCRNKKEDDGLYEEDSCEIFNLKKACNGVLPLNNGKLLSWDDKLIFVWNSEKKLAHILTPPGGITDILQIHDNIHVIGRSYWIYDLPEIIEDLFTKS